MMTNKITFGGIIVIISLATFLTYIATSNGLCLATDGYGYLYHARLFKLWWVAENASPIDKKLLADLLYFCGNLLKHWPPLYSFLLLAAGWFSDPYIAGRFLHLLFPVIIGILIFLTFRLFNKPYIHIFFTTAVILLAPHILVFDWFVLSEFLFFILQLSVMLSFSKYLYSKNDFHLLLTACFISLAGLTRYIGIAMAPALVTAIFYLNLKRMQRTSVITILFCVLLCILPVIIFISLPFSDNEIELVARRYFVWDPPNLLLLLGITCRSLILSLSPAWVPFPAKTIFAFCVMIFCFYIIRRLACEQKKNPPSPTIKQFQFFIGACITYYLLLILGFAFFCSDHFFVGINTRFMAPLFIWSVFFIGIMGSNEEKIKGNLWRKKLFIFIPLSILIIIYAWGSMIIALRTKDRNTYTTKLWKEDSVWHYLRNASHIKYIVSNEPGQVCHYSGIPAFVLPNRYLFSTYQDNNNAFLKYMNQLREMLHKKHGVVLYFNPNINEQQEILQNVGVIHISDCIRLLNLRVDRQTENCVILTPD